MAGLGLGFGILISALTTKYRDLRFLVQFGVTLLMYATPVIYPASAIPERFQIFIKANPMTPIVETFRYAFLGAGSVHPLDLLYSFGFMVVIMVIGIVSVQPGGSHVYGYSLMTTVISVENISKSYRLGEISTGTLSNDLKVWAARVRGKPNPLLQDWRDATMAIEMAKSSGRSEISVFKWSREKFWALLDVMAQARVLCSRSSPALLHPPAAG